MKKIIFILILILVVFMSLEIKSIQENIEEKKLEQEKINNEKLKEDILSHYSKYVISEKKINLYKLENDKYVKSGSIGKGEVIELKDIDITYNDEYLPLLTFDNYYVYYKDIIKSEFVDYDQRYKKYIPFNENIITKSNTSFYDSDDNLIYNFNRSFEFPIIIKDNDRYGIVYNNRLLYIKKNEIAEIKESNNTEFTNTSSIAVLNYHFFYDNELSSERKICDQTICLSTQLFKTHLEYIKNNNIFTPTLEEFEMYLDKKLQLPRSVVITIDDGWRSEQGIYALEEYELNGTVFLITVYHDEVKTLHDYKYVEYHSHGDNLHNQGDCPGGQGGAIKCKDREYLLTDLKISSEKLDGSKYFCYPFYEYNDYSISVLKEAGFTMAFEGGNKRAHVGVDKYRIPRYVIYSTTTADDIARYIGK